MQTAIVDTVVTVDLRSSLQEVGGPDQSSVNLFLSDFKRTKSTAPVKEAHLPTNSRWAYVNSYERLGMDDHILGLAEILLSSTDSHSTKFNFCVPRGYTWTVDKYELFYVH